MPNHAWIVIVAGLMASPALAQESEELDLSYEIAGGIAPWFLAWMDEEPTQPPFVWVAVPAGKSRLPVDYLRSTRRQSGARVAPVATRRGGPCSPAQAGCSCARNHSLSLAGPSRRCPSMMEATTVQVALSIRRLP